MYAGHNHPDDDQDYVAEYDQYGFPLKQYKPRQHPFKEWGERHFQRRYRLPKNVAKELSRDFIAWTPYEWLPLAGAIPLEDRFCLGLRYLATGANYTPIGATQGVSKPTITRCLDHVLAYFCDQYQKFIKWPENDYELLQHSVDWMHLHTSRPRCIGAIDGTHIPILKPSFHEPAFINRKGWHSINTMVVCDARQKFILVDPQYPGSVGDARVYNESALRDFSDFGGLDDYYLLGDSGYPVRQNLFTPVGDEQTAADRAYNIWHKSVRSIIERTIGIWKQRWRCLDTSAGYLYHKPEKAAQIAIATACLHNVCMDRNVPMEEDDHYDGYQAVRIPLRQPAQVVPHARHLAARGEFIASYF